MKKIMVVILFLLGLAGCDLETKTFDELYHDDLSKVDKITIIDGTTGSQKTTSDKNRIDEFLSDIKETKFVPDENQEPKKGFKYSILLFENKKETLQFQTNQINGNYYNTTPDIVPLVEEFFKRMEAEGE